MSSICLSREENGDFGKKLYGIPCSDTYWETTIPIFEKLEKLQNSRWEDLKNKENTIYAPLIEAFLKELTMAFSENGTVKKFFTSLEIKKLYQKELKTAGIETEFVDHLQYPTRFVDSVTFLEKGFFELFFDRWSLRFTIQNVFVNVQPCLKVKVSLVGVPCQE